MIEEKNWFWDESNELITF